MQSMKSYVVASALLACSTTALSGPITWDAAQGTAAATDVVTSGSLIQAINATDSNTGTVTVNGVSFSNSDALLDQTFSGDALNGATTGDTSYDTFLGSFDYGNGETTSISIPDSLLFPEASYLVQVWYTDLRGCCDGRNMTVGDDQGNSVDLNATGDGLGSFALGRFTASGNSQPLSLGTNGFSNVHITGYQVRQIPEPATLALMMAGLLGIAMVAARPRTGLDGKA